MKSKIFKLKAFFYKIFFPSNLKRLGLCSHCGSCCKKMYIIEGEVLLTDEAKFYEMQKEILFYKNITIAGKNDNGELFFSCKLLIENKCSKYLKRPKICRDYPSIKMHKYGGTLFEGCTFKFKPRKSFRFYLESNKWSESCVIFCYLCQVMLNVSRFLQCYSLLGDCYKFSLLFFLTNNLTFFLMVLNK